MSINALPFTPPAREALATAVHKIVCCLTKSNGYDKCLFYACVGANALNVLTGLNYRAVGGRSMITPDSPTYESIRHANGHELGQEHTVGASMGRPDGWRPKHAWIEREHWQPEIVDFSVRPTTWHSGEMPPWEEKARETKYDQLLADTQEAFCREGARALWLALPAIVADLDYDELKRLLERLSPHGERLTRRAFVYWSAVQAP